jgi:hypothetical protein
VPFFAPPSSLDPKPYKLCKNLINWHFHNPLILLRDGVNHTIEYGND